MLSPYKRLQHLFLFVFKSIMGWAMPETLDTRRQPKHPAARLLEITDKITSLFGQLIYVAGTWNNATGCYDEPRLAEQFDRREINWTLRRKHRKIFADWLALPLEQQAEELSQYLDEKSDNRPETVRSWIRKRWYERLVPKEAHDAERLLFTSDMEVLLPLVCRETSGEIYQ